MFIIESGGANKVLIDNKPPSERLNLTEIEGIIKNRAKLPFKGFANLSREGNVFYILANNKIYKGNPIKSWIEIADVSSFKGSYRCIEKKDNDVFRILTYDDRDYNLYLYEVSNNNVTLLKRIKCIHDVRVQYQYIMNNAIYQCYNTSSTRIYKTDIDTGTTTEITNQIVEEEGSVYLLSREETVSGYTKMMINNKLYIIAMGTPITIFTFDGERIKKFKTLDIQNAKCIYLSQIIQTNANKIYTILSGDYSDYYNYQQHFLLDEKFDVVDTFSTIYTFDKNSYFCIKENDRYTYITREHKDDKVYNLVEFPVKTYVINYNKEKG